ncbi:MAG: transposase [Desulfuromonadales bacterium]|nr:transposase [Desulfuromonadales bacterium]
MPRQPRLDIPDLLHHVIVRGIERRVIFTDNTDRNNFVDRLRRLLLETSSVCYAWALVPNHFHLLLRPGSKGLSHLMRRLLTGYAVAFNRRHNRSGHLFQNRYKSILCEEDTYQLELIRYLHLNPLRAGQCTTLQALDQFPWSGHAEILRNQPGVGLAADEVLSLFGRRKGSARIAYRQFIEDGLSMGKRLDLTGGGLLRSRQGGGDAEVEDYDERVLGGGDFVAGLRQNGLLETPSRQKIELPTLEQTVSTYYDLPHLRHRGRQNRAAQARAVFCYCAIYLQGYSGAEVGRYLNIGKASVSRALPKGEAAIGRDDVLFRLVDKLLKQ